MIHRRSVYYATRKSLANCVPWKWHEYTDNESSNEADGSESGIPTDFRLVFQARNAEQQPRNNRSRRGTRR